jgi:hypothetical protein
MTAPGSGAATRPRSAVARRRRAADRRVRRAWDARDRGASASPCTRARGTRSPRSSTSRSWNAPRPCSLTACRCRRMWARRGVHERFCCCSTCSRSRCSCSMTSGA